MKAYVAQPLHPEVKREQAAVRDAINSFIRAAETNNAKLLFKSLQSLEYNPWNGWKRLLTKAKTCSVHPDFRSTFLALWEELGDSLRDRIDDDPVLFDLLWLVLPPYTGPSIELFRGESAWNRRRRTYGPAWSADRAAATCFATGPFNRRCIGGTVLLRTVAPSAAIICAPHLLGARRRAEEEYIVDRRRLSDGVTVLKRFSQSEAEQVYAKLMT